MQKAFRTNWSSEDVIRMLDEAHFVLTVRLFDRVEYEHPGVPGRIAVPLREKCFTPLALRSIQRQVAKAIGHDAAGLKKPEHP